AHLAVACDLPVDSGVVVVVDVAGRNDRISRIGRTRVEIGGGNPVWGIEGLWRQAEQVVENLVDVGRLQLLDAALLRLLPEDTGGPGPARAGVVGLPAQLRRVAVLSIRHDVGRLRAAQRRRQMDTGGIDQWEP